MKNLSEDSCVSSWKSYIQSQKICLCKSIFIPGSRNNNIGHCHKYCSTVACKILNTKIRDYALKYGYKETGK